MTINEYLNHPMGKNSAIFMVGEAKNKMIERFLLVEDQLRLQAYNTGRTLVFHMEMPSESSKGLSYDIVIEVPFSSKDENKGNNIFDFPFNVYSNCPSFIYSYAYIFYKQKLICKWLVNRYDKKTLTTPPTKKNEFGIIFYEKSIFFAVYYIFKNMNQSVMLLEKSAKRASYAEIKEKITSQNDIDANRNFIKEIDKKEKAGIIPKKSVKGRQEMLEAAQTEESRGIRKARGTKKPKGAKGATKPKRPKKSSWGDE